MGFGFDDYAIGKGLDLALTLAARRESASASESSTLAYVDARRRRDRPYYGRRGLKLRSPSCTTSASSDGSRTVRKIWAEKSIDRLLLLLHWEFAQRTGVALEDVMAFKTDQQIREPLQDLLDGEAFDPGPLGPEIAQHFPDLPEADTLGDAMAHAAPRLVPFARDGSEAAISSQLEEDFAQVRALFARSEAQLAEFRAEFREQMAGLHHAMGVQPPRLRLHLERTRATRKPGAAPVRRSASPKRKQAQPNCCSSACAAATTPTLPLPSNWQEPVITKQRPNGSASKRSGSRQSN